MVPNPRILSFPRRPYGIGVTPPQQTPDRLTIPAGYFHHTGQGDKATPMIEIREADMFRFPCDAIVVPTDINMKIDRFGPFANKWHEYAGRNLEGYNRIVHSDRSGPQPVSALTATPLRRSPACKSPSK